jgi:2-keto-3-deoxy-galactonokinase
VVLRRKNKHGQFIELSEYGGGGRRSYVVILKGNDGKGWLYVWVQLQKMSTYHVKHQAGRTAAGRKIDAALKVALKAIGLGREGQSYAVVLGGMTSSRVGVPAEGMGQ